LQQVGARAFATATPVDPRQLPAIIRAPGRQALINAGHVWVLHRRAVMQAFAVAVCLVGIGGIYQTRDRLGAAAVGVYQLAQGELAHTAFAVGQISISGQMLTSDHDILAALAITPQTSTINFDVDAARAAVEKLPAVADASVRRIFPGRLVVNVTEKVPVARWRYNGSTYLVDQAGSEIGDAGVGYTELPLVVGEAAGDDAEVMIRAMAQFPALKQQLVALSRIADRRWDMIFKSGLRVQLPEQGVARALGQLDSYQRNYQLLDRDITLIDLRVPGLVAVVPSKDAAAQLAAAAKIAAAKNAGHFKADASYQTPAQRTASPGTH
jgi:cell division protein FtsQ